MKRIISRVLLTVALAAGAPLSVLWFTQATAQDYSGPQYGARRQESRKDYNTYLDPKSEANHDRDEQMRKLLSDYSRTDDEKERARVLDELTKVVAAQFDVRQEARDRELKQLEEHLRKLRELHQRRAKEKDQIVRDRVRQLLRDVEGLGWGDDGRLESSTPVREGPAHEGPVRRARCRNKSFREPDLVGTCLQNIRAALEGDWFVWNALAASDAGNPPSTRGVSGPNLSRRLAASIDGTR